MTWSPVDGHVDPVAVVGVVGKAFVAGVQGGHGQDAVLARRVVLGLVPSVPGRRDHQGSGLVGVLQGFVQHLGLDVTVGAEAEVDDVGAGIRGVDDRLDYREQGTLSVAVEHPHREDRGSRGHQGDGAGHERPVSDGAVGQAVGIAVAAARFVGRGRIVVDVVPPGDRSSTQRLVTGVDAGVEDGDQHLRTVAARVSLVQPEILGRRLGAPVLPVDGDRSLGSPRVELLGRRRARSPCLPRRRRCSRPCPGSWPGRQHPWLQPSGRGRSHARDRDPSRKAASRPAPGRAARAARRGRRTPRRHPRRGRRRGPTTVSPAPSSAAAAGRWTLTATQESTTAGDADRGRGERS